jgi:hypothetical protein
MKVKSKILETAEINQLIQEKINGLSTDIKIIATQALKLSENTSETAAVEQLQAFIKNYIKQKDGDK